MVQLGDFGVFQDVSCQLNKIYMFNFENAKNFKFNIFGNKLFSHFKMTAWSKKCLNFPLKETKII